MMCDGATGVVTVLVDDPQGDAAVAVQVLVDRLATTIRDTATVERQLSEAQEMVEDAQRHLDKLHKERASVRDALGKALVELDPGFGCPTG